MIVSWNWLREYVLLDMPLEELERRLMMAGLNHEGSRDAEGDIAIELEVTSNRPDCLGHLGVAREVAVLWQRELSIPAAAPKTVATPAADLTSVSVECPDLCPRYTARVIRGVTVGPSPSWLVNRLRTLGIAAINNVVDITNYVLMECSQPLHAFDLDRLSESRIVVRRGRKGEKFEAINHRTYELTTEMCAICDAERPVALGGVMGGAATEVRSTTTNLLIEAAEFDPLSIRRTSRALNLHSDSSFRFERGVDPEAIDWASRRCAELILDLCGGELAEGVIDVGGTQAARPHVSLRFNQLPRVLGIDVDALEVRRILTELGNQEVAADAERVEVIPPSWRRDLTREIDLVEEVARIHGYDAIPEDVRVPIAASSRREEDVVLEKVRHALTAVGFDEAMTLSAVDEKLSDAFSPWTARPALELETPVLRGADRLRRSLLPSLLVSRQLNEALGADDVHLFETAKIYLPTDGGLLPEEPWMLALVSDGDFSDLKGVLETLVAALNPSALVEAEAIEDPFFHPAQAAELRIGGGRWGVIGVLSEGSGKAFDLRSRVSVAEVRIDRLEQIAVLVPQYVAPLSYPAVVRDLNLVVAESVKWADLANTIRDSGGTLLERLDYRETYRSRQLGQGKKSVLLTLTLRDPEGTLRSEQADEVTSAVLEACGERYGAELRGAAS